MKSSNTYRWFGATIALLILMMPLLLTDELSLFVNWGVSFICWLIIIVIGLLIVPTEKLAMISLKASKGDLFQSANHTIITLYDYPVCYCSMVTIKQY